MGTPRSPYTPEQRTAALATYRTDGHEAASAEHGIPAGTIRRWAAEAGVKSEHTSKIIEANRVAVEAARLTLEQRKQALADRMIEEANRLLDDMRTPVSEEKIVVLSGGATAHSTYEAVTIDRDPTPAEKRQLMTAAAIAVDKTQVLTGGATARFGVEASRDPQVAETADRIVAAVSSLHVVRDTQVAS